jgi:hypothetical protein
MSVHDLPGFDPVGHRLFHCPGCGYEIECLVADADRYAKVGCPLCGATVVPVEPPLPDVPAEQARNKRLVQRRLVRGGAKVEVRRGSMGLGPNLAVGLADVSEDGLGVRLKVEVRPAEECEVLLIRPGGGKPIKMHGDFRWCTPAGDGTFRAGVRFQRRLARTDLLALAQSRAW